MKKYAFFLPQFHCIPENDKWWGKNFTEWVNVKKTDKLFKGHNQPKKPLNDNYYNLLDEKTVIWQTELLNNYNVDGLIYYHYYFKGKKLLEKPAENLLKRKDIKQNFFFCWANHSWIRSWNNSKEILIEQEYGNESDWENHFQYLLPFFKDERYEKKNNKPLFMIFKSTFKEKNEMFDYFNIRAIQEGFLGIEFIETFHGEISIQKFNEEKSSLTSYVFYREPAVSLNNYLKRRNIVRKVFDKILNILRQYNLYKIPRIYKGEVFLKNKIKTEKLDDNSIPGIFFEWDNTPRHKHRGYIIKSYLKEQFFEYMNLIKDCEYVFINAWNEWCEGMILEPTEENKYKYLEWIKEYQEREK